MLLQNAKDHYLPSMLLIGELSLEGRYVAHDFAKGIEWFQIAASKSAEAEVPLAKALLASEDPRTKQQGIDRLLSLAKAGDAYAMIAIGDYCSSERSKKVVLSDKESSDEIKNEALKRRRLLDESCFWYGEAAKQNITEAICKLAGASSVRELIMEMDKQGDDLSARLQKGFSPIEMHLRASRDVLLDAMGAEGEQYQENAFQMKADGQ